MSRVETGVVQFGSDWPGVFIRGDNAARYAMALRQVLDNDGPGKVCSGFERSTLAGLADLLSSSDVRSGPAVQLLPSVQTDPGEGQP